MEDYDDLSNYDGNPEHDMWVDFTRYEYTGEGAENFEDSDLAEEALDSDEWD